jgi:FkbM family methyltransferase
MDEASRSSVIGRGLRAAVSLLPPSTAYHLQRVLSPTPVLGRGMRMLTASAAKGEGVIKYGPASGLRIDATGTGFSFLLGTWGPDEQKFLATRLRPGDVFYDLGAHIGFFSLLAARLVGPTGRVVAFEPSPLNAAQLERNIELNGFTNVTLVEAAVSSEAGFAQFDPANDRVAARLTGHGESARDALLSVRTISIDGWRAETGFPDPGLIKIDVEGAEIAALQGALGVIQASRPVLLVEVHPTVGPAFADYVEGTLRPLGYRATSLTNGPIRLSNKGFHVVLLPEQSS